MRGGKEGKARRESERGDRTHFPHPPSRSAAAYRTQVSGVTKISVEKVKGQDHRTSNIPTIWRTVIAYETLENWTDGGISCRHSAPSSFLVIIMRFFLVTIMRFC